MPGAETVNSIRHYYPTTARDYLRHGAVSALARWQKTTGRQAQYLQQNRMHFIMLHSVFPDEEAGFRKLLKALATTHEFVSYSEAVHRLETGNFAKPSITFSFDDGMKNNLVAGKILGEFGAKACFFICTNIAGETDSGQLRKFSNERLRGPAVDFLNWDEIERLLRSGHEIGSHTKSHPNLADLGSSGIDEELGGSMLELQRRIGINNAAHFAWPYGRFENVPADFGRIVARHRYQSCASGVRGCHVMPLAGERHSLYIRRDNIIAGWPVEHSLYFLARSAATSTAASNTWPIDQGACE